MLSKGAPFGNVACPRFAVYRARITFRGRAGKVVAPDGVRQVHQRLDSGHVPVPGEPARTPATRHARSGWPAHRHAPLEIRSLTCLATLVSVSGRGRQPPLSGAELSITNGTRASQ